MSNAILTQHQRDDSPSFKFDGIQADLEQTQRVYACELIQRACLLLKLPVVVMARACVLLHRFYQKRSIREFDVRLTAAACVFMSAKLEEAVRKMRDVLNTFHRLAERESNDSKQQQFTFLNDYEKRDDLILRERIILVELGFQLHVEHPHKFLLFYLHVLEGDENMAQCAWNYLNDSLRTRLCLKYEPSVIAVGAIHLAARKLQHKLPEKQGECWWELFNVTREQLEDVERQITDLYAMPKVQYIDLSRGATASSAPRQ